MGTGQSNIRLCFWWLLCLSLLSAVVTVLYETYSSISNRPIFSKRGVYEGEVQTLLKLRSSKNRTNDEYADDKEYQHDKQYRYYMKCPTSIRRKMLNIPEMQDKYIPDMPLLMWNEHLNKAEYNRLSKHFGKHGFKYIPFEVFSDAMARLNTRNNRYLFDDRLVNGTLTNENACVRCAVVGNGGILNGSKKGKEIDEHDYVFRVNSAVIKGYEEDVGSRTSFYCTSLQSLVNCLRAGRKSGFTSPPGDDGIRYVIFGKKELSYRYINSSLGGEPTWAKVCRPRRSCFPKNLTAEDIKITHPDFIRYTRWSWIKSVHQHKAVNGATTGALMMILAIHTCDEVSAYGFGSYNEFSEYYFDKFFGRHQWVVNHDARAQNRLWKRLDELGIINLYKRRRE